MILKKLFLFSDIKFLWVVLLVNWDPIVIFIPNLVMFFRYRGQNYYYMIYLHKIFPLSEFDGIISLELGVGTSMLIIHTSITPFM